jgi:hypothetical protein
VSIAGKQPPRNTAHFAAGNGLMAASIRGAATAGTQPPVALTFRTPAQLRDELGGPEVAAVRDGGVS